MYAVYIGTRYIMLLRVLLKSREMPDRAVLSINVLCYIYNWVYTCMNTLCTYILLCYESRNQNSHFNYEIVSNFAYFIIVAKSNWFTFFLNVTGSRKMLLVVSFFVNPFNSPIFLILYFKIHVFTGNS